MDLSLRHGGALQLTSGPRTARRQTEVLLFDFSDQYHELLHICKTSLQCPLSGYQGEDFPRISDSHYSLLVLELHRQTCYHSYGS